MSYDSVTSDPERLAKIKNFTMFEQDLANNALPQWMFITPNMSKFSWCLHPPTSTDAHPAHNAHDTDINVAGTWAKGFLEPLLANKNFLSKTLVLLSESSGFSWGLSS